MDANALRTLRDDLSSVVVGKASDMSFMAALLVLRIGPDESAVRFVLERRYGDLADLVRLPDLTARRNVPALIATLRSCLDEKDIDRWRRRGLSGRLLFR